MLSLTKAPFANGVEPGRFDIHLREEVKGWSTQTTPYTVDVGYSKITRI